ncbi:MAG: hypothetical protein ACFFKA_22400 [Candidatus Thorarchaeota archaeon]
MDCDGDLDVFIANEDYGGNATRSRLYINDGTGAFTWITGHFPLQEDDLLPVHLFQRVLELP